MKVAFIFLTSFLGIITACSTQKNTAGQENIEIVSATYKPWSEPPPSGSDIPERGIDLTITVKNWPTSYKPEYIIYNKQQSFSASVASQSDSQTIIEGRIIRTSSRLTETSKSVNQSDRIVYTNQDGNKEYIAIEQWKQAGKK
jgi:hypothetical protein